MHAGYMETPGCLVEVALVFTDFGIHRSPENSFLWPQKTQQHLIILAPM